MSRESRCVLLAPQQPARLVSALAGSVAGGVISANPHGHRGLLEAEQQLHSLHPQLKGCSLELHVWSDPAPRRSLASLNHARHRASDGPLLLVEIGKRREKRVRGLPSLLRPLKPGILGVYLALFPRDLQGSRVFRVLRCSQPSPPRSATSGGSSLSSPQAVVASGRSRGRSFLPPRGARSVPCAGALCLEAPMVRHPSGRCCDGPVARSRMPALECLSRSLVRAVCGAGRRAWREGGGWQPGPGTVCSRDATRAKGKCRSQPCGVVLAKTSSAPPHVSGMDVCPCWLR